MKTVIALSLSAAATLALGACAADQTANVGQPDGRACFMPRDVENWRVESGRTATFQVSRKDVWRADLLSMCSDLNSAETISVQSKIASPWICTGDDARIVIPRSTFSQSPCEAVDFRKLTSEEVAAAKAARSAKRNPQPK